MSTMILQKDYEGRKAGEKISVPFGKGRDMLKAGIAAYAPPTAPNPSKVSTAARPEIDVLREKAEAEFKALKEKHRADVEGLKADIRIANDEAKAALDLADKATAENAELKKQIADLQKSLAEKPKAAK